MLAADFAGKNPKIAKLIQPVQEHPDMVTAMGQLASLKEKLAPISEKIFSLGNRKADSSEDAQRVLDNKPLKSQAVSLQDLNRQKAAVERAIQIQTQNIQEIELALIRSGVKEIASLAEGYAKDTIAAFDACKAAIIEQMLFFNYLMRKGYSPGKLPAAWTVTPYERNFLNTIDYFLDGRRAAWKFESKKMKRKS